jgi:predicted nucleic acid-binding protein
VLSDLIRTRRAVFSTQVMQEYFTAATRKLGLSPERARIRVGRLNRLDVVIVRPELILGLLLAVVPALASCRSDPAQPSIDV